MTSTDFAFVAEEDGPEDLPRTLRREREARQRAKREEEDRQRAATLTHDFGPPERTTTDYPSATPAPAATVTHFDVPFAHLMTFFIKAVVAAIPALFLLGVLLWFAGFALKSLYPELVHTEILIRIPR